MPGYGPWELSLLVRLSGGREGAELGFIWVGVGRVLSQASSLCSENKDEKRAPACGSLTEDAQDPWGGGGGGVRVGGGVRAGGGAGSGLEPGLET